MVIIVTVVSIEVDGESCAQDLSDLLSGLVDIFHGGFSWN